MRIIYFKGRQTDDGRWIDTYTLTINRNRRLEDRRRRRIRAAGAATMGVLAAVFIARQAGTPADQVNPVQDPIVTTATITEITTTAATPVSAPTLATPAVKWVSAGEFEITAYCSCEICCGYWATVRPQDADGNPIVYTSTGEIAEQGTTIAVDPEVIPYGTKVMIGGHVYTAQDTGGDIKGNRIDVYFSDHQDAKEYGRRFDEVFILPQQ